MTNLLARLPVRRVLAGTAALLIIVFIALQLVPYGRDHDNPPVLADVQWDSPRTRELAVKACYACHSNETHWPWYSSIAPVSWLVQKDVDEGRDKLNFSDWNRVQETDDIVESVVEGEMPPLAYKFRSWDRISNDEKDELIAGLRLTFGAGETQDRDSGERD
ncbi:MAG: heme-binding domain-containing protein [Chloroflexi bacterium]|nr:heme-binding domain-containing protein [Chloroflexota bacterium]MDA1297758.1 heme-binding domain-containing protein [Chloroflexota bacterium]